MKNKFEIRGETTAVFLQHKGVTLETLIDTKDLSLVQQMPHTWLALYNTFIRGHYAVAHINLGDKRKLVYLHRWIMQTQENLVVDHINHSTLDNRRNNLRVVTRGENMQNRKLAQNNTSGFRGVSYVKRIGKWRVVMKVNGHYKYFGAFEDILKANEVAQQARAKYLPFSQEALN